MTDTVLDLRNLYVDIPGPSGVVHAVRGVSLAVRWNGSSAELPPEVIIRAHLTAGAKLYAINLACP